MALGFRDCCNEFNYFFLTETPASVSEFEVYYIETVEGPTFCATYLNLPPLNYTPTTYNVVNLSQITDCNTCNIINPCPTEENILQNQFGVGSVITQPDCNFTSIRYLDVECFPVNPTYENSLDGQVVLFASGGVPPYIFRDFYTNQVLAANPTIDNFYTVLTNIPAGDYRFLVSDTGENFVIDITCTLTAPPPFPVFTAETIDASVYGKPDGQINLIVLSAGTPNYTFVINGVVYTNPSITIGAGTYDIIIYDEYYTTQITVTVGQPPPVDYPQNLCFTTRVDLLNGCSEFFGILLERFVNDYDYRAQYFATNPEILGLSSLNIRYEESQGGWVTDSTTWGGSPQFSNPCGGSQPVSQEITFIKIDGTTDIPEGEWSSQTLYFSNVYVSAGVCTPVFRVNSTTNVCNQTPIIYGSVTFEVGGGAGGPYKIFVTSSTGGQIVSTNPIIGNLSAGDYTAYALDNQGNQSDTVNFTINSITPFVLNLTNLNQCVTTTYNTVFLNVIPGGRANSIDPGESRRTRITTTTNFNFNFLPDDFEITTTIRIDVGFRLNVSVTPYTDPRIYFTANSFNYTVSPITTSTITTDGITSNFMDNVTPQVLTLTNPFLGDGWYRQQPGTISCATGTGNCPLPLEVNGARYQKILRWTSNVMRINKTTSISLSYFNDFINSVPIIESTLVNGCYNGCGGGQLFADFEARMLTPTKTKGCGSVSGTFRRLIFYAFSQHPRNGAGFNAGILPTPQCP